VLEKAHASEAYNPHDYWCGECDAQCRHGTKHRWTCHKGRYICGDCSWKHSEYQCHAQ
jgi:hypothetical protein